MLDPLKNDLTKKVKDKNNGGRNQHSENNENHVLYKSNKRHLQPVLIRNVRELRKVLVVLGRLIGGSILRRDVLPINRRYLCCVIPERPLATKYTGQRIGSNTKAILPT
jgi:hypothetical protein